MGSRLTQRPRIELNVNLQLNESEIRALDALVGYGDKAFLKAFYAQLGEAYLKPHEAGLVSLFATVRENLPRILKRQDAAKKAFALDDPVIRGRTEHNELIARITASKEPQ